MVDTVDLLGVSDIWAKGYTGSGWHVAIIDTGIRRTHEFFQGKNIVEACFSARSHCPNNQRSMFGNGAAAHHPSMYDGYDHGTHVAGIAVGHKADGSLSGVAKDANIIAINVFSRFSDCDGNGTPCVSSSTSDLLAALDYIYSLRGSYNIGAVNMSLGGGRYGIYCDSYTLATTTINLLRDVKIPTAIATGNDGWCGSLGAPACVSSSIAVMASTKTDQETPFNNWHATIGNLFAPGKDIYSATGDSNSSYAFWSGTSMSTPHVAGGLTLMRQNEPGASPAELLTSITKNGPSITTLCPDAGKKPRIYLKIETGSLQVVIEPASVREAGAQWRRMETETWRNSGDTEIHIPIGPQRVVFNRVDDWTRPRSIGVTVNTDQTTTVTGTYIETPEKPFKSPGPGVLLLLLDK
jgi:subtilisin family serine protease